MKIMALGMLLVVLVLSVACDEGEQPVSPTATAAALDPPPTLSPEPTPAESDAIRAPAKPPTPAGPTAVVVLPPTLVPGISRDAPSNPFPTEAPEVAVVDKADAEDSLPARSWR